MWRVEFEGHAIHGHDRDFPACQTVGLRDISSDRRLAIIAVCAVAWRAALADVVIETHDRIVGRTWQGAKKLCDAKIADAKTAVQDTLRAFKSLGAALLDARSDGAPLDQATELACGWDRLEGLVATAAELTDTMAADLLADLRDRAERAREAYIVAREQEAGRFSAAVDAAKALFAPSGSDEFAAGFTEAWSAQEEARQRELAEERERVRQQELTDQRDAFVEGVAQALEATWQIRDPEQAKDQQSRIVDQVRRRADTFETSFDVLAGAIDTRASEIQEHRARQKRQEELEREQQRQAARDRSSDYGYGL